MSTEPQYWTTTPKGAHLARLIIAGALTAVFACGAAAATLGLLIAWLLAGRP